MLPWGRGGTDDPNNLVFACARCNSGKGSCTAEEFRPLLFLRRRNQTRRFFAEFQESIRRDFLHVASPGAIRALARHSVEA